MTLYEQIKQLLPGDIEVDATEFTLLMYEQFQSDTLLYENIKKIYSLFLIEKNSSVIMTPASAGLARYYEHILKNIDVVLKTKSPSDDDLDQIEIEDRDEHENLVAEEDLEAILENFEVDNKTFH